MDEIDRLHLRLDCLRVAVEFGSQRDVLRPDQLADTYYEWVIRGSKATCPEDSRKDDGLMSAKKTRGVRKPGSAPQSSNVNV